jgi:hypothetical protein
MKIPPPAKGKNRLLYQAKTPSARAPSLSTISLAIPYSAPIATKIGSKRGTKRRTTRPRLVGEGQFANASIMPTNTSMKAQIPPGSRKITVITKTRSINTRNITVTIKMPSIAKKNDRTFLAANLKLTEISSANALGPDLLPDIFHHQYVAFLRINL